MHETYRVWADRLELPVLYSRYEDALFIAQHVKREYPEKIISILGSKGHYYPLEALNKGLLEAEPKDS